MKIGQMDLQNIRKKTKQIAKLIKRFILFLFLLFVLRIVWMAWLIDLSVKPDITHYRPFDSVLVGMRNAITGFIYDEKNLVDVGNDYINREFFESRLLESLYTLNTIENMKGYFDADVFNIFIHNNLCFVRADLDKAAHYISRNPLKLRQALAEYSAYFSKYLFENFYDNRSEWKYIPTRFFLGNFNISSPILFTEEMNDLYILISVLENDPPISLSEFPN